MRKVRRAGFDSSIQPTFFALSRLWTRHSFVAAAEPHPSPSPPVVDSPSRAQRRIKPRLDALPLGSDIIPWPTLATIAPFFGELVRHRTPPLFSTDRFGSILGTRSPPHTFGSPHRTDLRQYRSWRLDLPSDKRDRSEEVRASTNASPSSLLAGQGTALAGPTTSHLLPLTLLRGSRQRTSFRPGPPPSVN